MIKFIHTADIHFGVENYGKVDPKTGLHTRFLDFVKSFSICVDKAISYDVDLFILAGDAYKTANPTPTQQKFLLKELFRLQKAGIKVAVVVGNHDHPLSFGKAHALDVYSDLPIDGFFVFSKPEAVKIETKSGPVQVVGIPWPSRQNILTKGAFFYKSFQEITEKISESVAQIISKLAKELDPSLPAILTGHLTVANGIFSGSERKAVFGSDPVFLPSQLAIKPFNYVALGHLHRYQNLNPKGSIPVVYSGSPERIDFGEVREEKGFCFGKIEKSEKGLSCSYVFEELPARKMIEIEVFLKDSICFTAQIVDEIKKHKIENSIVKLIYHIPEGFKDKVDLVKIYKLLNLAWHVVGIFPVHKVNTRQARIKKSKNESTESLLEKYLDLKFENKEKIKELLEKGKKIIEELSLEELEK